MDEEATKLFSVLFFIDERHPSPACPFDIEPPLATTLLELFRNECDEAFVAMSLFCKTWLLVLIMTTCGRLSIGESIWVRIWLGVPVVFTRFGADMLADTGFKTPDNWDMFMIFLGWLVDWMSAGVLIWVQLGILTVDAELDEVAVVEEAELFIITNFLFSCWMEDDALGPTVKLIDDVAVFDEMSFVFEVFNNSLADRFCWKFVI